MHAYYGKVKIVGGIRIYCNDSLPVGKEELVKSKYDGLGLKTVNLKCEAGSVGARMAGYLASFKVGCKYLPVNNTSLCVDRNSYAWYQIYLHAVDKSRGEAFITVPYVRYNCSCESFITVLYVRYNCTRESLRYMKIKKGRSDFCETAELRTTTMVNLTAGVKDFRDRNCPPIPSRWKGEYHQKLYLLFHPSSTEPQGRTS